jgi:MFS family permease
MPQIESDFSLRKMKIAGAVLLGQMFASSLLPMMALTLVYLPLTTEFGWTQTQFGYATTALMWCGGLVGPLLGYLVDRTGVRLMIIGGTVMVGLITIAISLTRELWHFYLGFGLLGLFGTTAIGYAKVLTALFTQHRGKALALFGLESSLAAAFLPQLIQSLLERFGWRGLFVIMGLTIIALVPLLYFALEEPGTVGGSRRLFVRERAALRPPERLPELEGLTAREVFRTSTYWLIIVAMLCVHALLGGVLRRPRTPLRRPWRAHAAVRGRGALRLLLWRASPDGAVLPHALFRSALLDDRIRGADGAVGATAGVDGADHRPDPRVDGFLRRDDLGHGRGPRPCSAHLPRARPVPFRKAHRRGPAAGEPARNRRGGGFCGATSDLSGRCPPGAAGVCLSRPLPAASAAAESRSAARPDRVW